MAAFQVTCSRNKTVAFAKHWQLYQLGINHTFLYDNFYEEVYMTSLLGFLKPSNIYIHYKKLIINDD